ncbi:transposase family protein [Pseudomonas sp. QL9]|uniref:transposase family protein n=1 Tax=Pseudomonas sp. QL9 TaxID=3242725 RepID=UPI00352A6B38
MPNATVLPPFGEGYSVVSMDSEADTLRIELEPDRWHLPRCGSCQQPRSSTHEYCTRCIRDLPILGRPVVLQVRLRRMACSRCGQRQEWVSWLQRRARMTRRLSAFCMCW